MVSIWRFVKNVWGFRAASSLVVVVVAAGGMPNSTLTAFVFSVVYPATSARPVRINDRTWQAPPPPPPPPSSSFPRDPPLFPAIGLSVSFWPPQAVCRIKRVKNRSSAPLLHRPYVGNVNRCLDERIHRTRRRHAELCRDLNRPFEHLSKSAQKRAVSYGFNCNWLFRRKRQLDSPDFDGAA
ncbi:hypothetical protein QTP88_006392 [Uroleucon formosanum]